MKKTREERAWSGILRWTWLVVPLLVILLLIRAWPPERGLLRRSGTWERIQREGVLRVGTDASYPPFEWINGQGEFVGYDVELVRRLAHRWGLEPQFINVHFDGLYDALQAEKIDLIVSALPYDRTKTQDLLYSDPYFNAGQVLVAPRGNASIQSVEDLGGRRVGVELGARGHQLLRQLARDRGVTAEIVTGRRPEEVFSLLREGAVEALVCDRVTAYDQMDGEQLRIVEPPLTSAPFVIAARPDAGTLIGRVDEALDAWQESGFLVDLEQRWLR
jgi:polar amino acid transport system substrate-binding protein